MKFSSYLMLAAAGLTMMACEKDQDVSPAKQGRAVTPEQIANSSWQLTDYTVETKAVNSNSSQVHSIFTPCYGLDKYTLTSDGRILWTQLEGSCTYGTNGYERSVNSEIGTWLLKDDNTKLQIKSTWGWVYWEMKSRAYETTELDAENFVMERQDLSSHQDTLYTRKLIFTRVK